MQRSQGNINWAVGRVIEQNPGSCDGNGVGDKGDEENSTQNGTSSNGTVERQSQQQATNRGQRHACSRVEKRDARTFPEVLIPKQRHKVLQSDPLDSFNARDDIPFCKGDQQCE